MTARLALILAGASALALQVGPAAADGAFGGGERSAGTWWRGLLHPRICGRPHLSDETRAWCDGIADLHGRELYKATVLENLQRANQPPVAVIEILEVLPRRLDVSAEASTDEDGLPTLHHFRLEDADTGDVLAGPMTTLEPVASLESDQDLPPGVRAIVTVEDDLGATDSAEQVVALEASICSNELFSCSTGALGNTTCSPTTNNKAFTTDDVLDAGQRCDRTLTKSTQVTITARGGAGGKGKGHWLGKRGGFGGEGGGARMVTTLAELDRAYEQPGSATTYCYGIGAQGGQSGSQAGGAGGAATLLRTCQNVSQTEITGVLLIAGGGGGGQAASGVAVGKNGRPGGVAASGPGTSASGRGGGGGRGGGDGTGGVGSSSSGRGKDGVGGKGGTSSWGTAEWSSGNPRVDGSTGQGGSISGCAGAGGGGWGGGGCQSGEGGGGGGSYAAPGLAQAPGPGISKGPGSLTFRFEP